MTYRIVVDQSTVNTKAILFNIRNKGEFVEKVDRIDIPHEQIYPKKGFIEHNPIEIINNTKKAIELIIENNNLLYKDIVSISITNQRETIMIWDKKTGIPHGNAMVWKCNRGVDICNKLIKEGYEEIIREKTGLKIDPYFSASKLSYFFLNNYLSDEEKKHLAIGTIDTWLIWNLSDEKNFFTEESNASRTLLFNIKEKKWDKKLCELFHVPIKSLPKVVDSYSDFGTYKGIKINSVLADSQSALLGNKCINKGQMKATFGTGSSMMLNIGNELFEDSRIVTTIAWNKNGKTTYALEGIIKSYGDILNWGKNHLKLYNDYEEASNLAFSNDFYTDVLFIPAIQGLSAPFWKPYSTGVFFNLITTSTNRDFVRAMFNSLAFQTRAIIDLYSEILDYSIPEIYVDGGFTKNKLFMQLVADITKKTIFVMDIEEASALGTLIIMDGMENYKPKINEKYTPSYDYESDYNKWLKLINKIF